MTVQILTPTESLYDGEVESVLVPGTQGTFHILDKHAAIVSTITEGKVQVYFKDTNNLKLHKSFTPDTQNKKVYNLAVKGGIVEMNNNQVIILCD